MTALFTGIGKYFGRLRPAAVAAAVVVLVCLASANAQGVRLEIGIAGNIVVDAWNPVRLVANDVPPGSLLTVTIDQGTLRSGAIPAVLRLPVSGGGGVSVVEERLYVPPFRSITWSLGNEGRVVGSGSVAGREHDPRPLDMIVSRQPGRYASSFPAEARVIDLGAAELPLSADAYDGVRSVLIDGTGTAPRLEAIAAAAAGGAIVVLHGDLPASHAELGLLVGDGFTRLGAGGVTTSSGAPVDAVGVIQTYSPLDRPAMIEQLTVHPLVEPPQPASQALMLSAAAVFAVVVIALLRFFSAPGLVSAVLLAALLSVAGWRALRPSTAELVGSRTLALAGGELALTIEAREYFTLPATTIQVDGGARPLAPTPYTLDRTGLQVALPRWRSQVVFLPPQVAAFPLRFEAGVLRNAGGAAMTDVIVVGYGPQDDLAAGERNELMMGEQGPLPPMYTGLLGRLPDGSVVATSGCPDQCTIWLAPSMVDVAHLDADEAEDSL